MNRLLIVFLVFVSYTTYAGDTVGTISDLVVNDQDQVLIAVGEMSNLDECASLSKYVLDLTTIHGKAMYSMILSAQAQKKPIKIAGSKQCNIRSNAESVRYVRIVE